MKFVFIFLLSVTSLVGNNIELFVYWRPEYKGQDIFHVDGLFMVTREKLLERKWDIFSWDKDTYRPWLLSWKEVKTGQEFKWRLGLDLPTKSPFKEDTKYWVFLSLGPHTKHHDFGRVLKA
jgi:hypothetical protein